LKRALLRSLIALQLLMVACEPGMLVRQVNDPGKDANSSLTPQAKVVVQVKTTNQLIGEKWYDPEVQVANGSGSPITVTDIELSVQGKSYTNKYAQLEALSLTIQPGSAAALKVGFRLDTDVWNTLFRKPAELLVRYQIGAGQKLARVSVVGAHLDGSR
jgi:LEA14-like dessication related protein